MGLHVKRIDIKEFREKGYLQELNRRFLHPLGLALEVVINKDTGEEKLGGIWDMRDDQTGIYYHFSGEHKENIKTALSKKEFIDKEMEKRLESRNRFFGFDIEPII